MQYALIGITILFFVVWWFDSTMGTMKTNENSLITFQELGELAQMRAVKDRMLFIGLSEAEARKELTEHNCLFRTNGELAGHGVYC